MKDETKDILWTIIKAIIIAFFLFAQIIAFRSYKSENDQLRALIIAASEQQMDKKTIETISRKILKKK